MAKLRSAAHAVTAPSRATPLELAPLLEAYRKHGKLSLRVERVQQLARLSRGRNNGDGTWSLAFDELEDLEYLSPEGANLAQTSLAIRIIGVDKDLATLALLDYPIPDAGKQISRERQGSMRTDPAPDRSGDKPAQRHLEELESLKALLAEREADLARMQREAEQAEPPTSDNITTRDTWKIELDQRLAATEARSAAALDDSRAAWQADQNALLAETKRLAEQRLSDARERWLREAEDVRKQSETEWKAAESARLARAEAEWREKNAKALAELSAKCEHAEAALAEARARAEIAKKSERDEGEHRRVLEELAKARVAVADRDAALAQAAAASKLREEERLAEARQHWRREADEARAQAEVDWKALESARFAKAELEWREKATKAVAELTAKCERAEAALSDARAKPAYNEGEHRQLRDELAATSALLADRDAELTRTAVAAKEREEQRLAEARQRWRREADDARAQAEADWKVTESARAAKAEAEWREKAAKAVADLSARCERAEAALADARARPDAPIKTDRDDPGNQRLREELASTRAALADRDKELASRSNAEQALERQRQESEAAIARAKAEWKQTEVARLTAAEAAWQKQSSDALAAATARVDEAERALEQVRSKTGSKRRSDDEGVVSRLRDEIASLQAALADRDRELNQSRTAREPRDSSAQSKITLRDDRRWRTEETPPRQPKKSGRIVLEVIVVAGLAALVTVFWPTIETFIPQSWWTSLGYPAKTETIAASAPAPVQPPMPTAPPVEAQPAATIIRSANVRSDPASTATVLARVERGVQVAVVGLHGNWTHVRIDGNGATKPIEGWVFNSYLANPGVADKTPPAATAKRNTPSRNVDKASSAATGEPSASASGDDRVPPTATSAPSTSTSGNDKAPPTATSEPGTPSSGDDKAAPSATSEPATPPPTDAKKPTPEP
jgi:hypothetical protein